MNRKPLFRHLFMFVILGVSQMSFAKLYVNVSVDWEGRVISENNIKAMESFRKKFPHVPILHFLNPAYFTKKNANPEQIKKQMIRVIEKEDELGLHIHSWKSLVKKAGVEYRSTPTWSRWGGGRNCISDCGHGVPLWAYTEEELKKIVHQSLDILESHGYGRAKSFRAGGWMSSPKVLKVLASEGITLDASAVPRRFLESSQPIITKWIDKYWPGVTTTSQPYKIETAAGSIREFPNNGCLSDYMTGRMMLSVFKDNVKLWKKDTEKDYFISIGFHQETAERYLPELERALELIERHARNLKISLAYTANPLRILN